MMPPYKPTFTHNTTISSSSKNWTCGYVPKNTESNRGGLGKITDDLLRYNRFPRNDLINFTLDNNASLSECPPPEPTPTPTSSYDYTTSVIVNEVP